MSSFKLVVPLDFLGTKRVDKYFSENTKNMNRSKLKSGISEIFINEKTAKLSSKVKAGDIITVFWQDTIPEDILGEDLPLDIVFEDENVTVINKKQGMVTHPAAGNWTGTLVNALLYHWAQASKLTQTADDSQNSQVSQLTQSSQTSHEKSQLSQNPSSTSAKKLEYFQETTLQDISKKSRFSQTDNSFSVNPATKIEVANRPGIVHRLDKETSGIIITAKNRSTEEFLQKQFKMRKVQKEYIAIVCGKPPHRGGVIETQIIRDPHNRKYFKATTDTKNGKYAKTIYYCIACYGNYSLMRFRLKTGRTHQIRVHCKFIGCPILGDSIYNTKKETLFKNATLMLHSRLLKIKVSKNSALYSFFAKIPTRFKDVLKILHEKFPKEVINK